MANADCSNRTRYEDATSRRAQRILENRLRAPGAPVIAGRRYTSFLERGRLPEDPEDSTPEPAKLKCTRPLSSTIRAANK